MSNFESGAVWSDFPEQTSFDLPEGQPQLPNQVHEDMREQVDEVYANFDPYSQPEETF